MNCHPIKECRLRYGFSQKQVYSGLCPATTLSKTENCSQNPEFLLLESLAGRLGLDTTEFETHIDSKDYRLFEARFSILTAVNGENYEEARHLLDLYEEKMPHKPLHRQFVLYQRARLKKLEREDLYTCNAARAQFDFPEIFFSQNSSAQEASERLIRQEEEYLIQAWNQTKKTFEVREEELYTPAEIHILLDLIHINSCRWCMEQIMKQLEDLLLKIEKLFTGNLLDDLRNACMWEILCRGKETWSIHKLLERTEDAIRVLSPWRSFRHAIRLHIFKAQVLSLFLERPGDTAVEREQFIRECRMVYFSFDSLGQEWRRERIAAYCMEKTGVDIRI